MAFWGVSKKGYFFESFIAFSCILCFLSILLPFNSVVLLINLVFAFGLIAGFMKIRSLALTDKVAQFKSYFSSANRFEKFLICFCIAHILSGLVGTTVLGGEGAVIDAMTYHLGGPKEWALFLNGPKLNLLNPETLTASYYEYLIYPLFILLKPVYAHLTPLETTSFEFLNYTVLIWGQIFSGVIGLIFIPKLVWDLCKKNMMYFYLILILILGLKGMNWVWITAKNDAFPLFCTLVAARFFLRNFEKRNDVLVIFLSFFFLGVGLGAKMTNIYPMVLILIYMFVRNLDTIKAKFNWNYTLKLIFVAAGSGLIALLPFFLRNFIETSNPFYPTSSAFFENIYLTDSIEAVHKLYSHPTTWTIAFEKLKRLYVHSPGFILITVVSLCFKRWKEPLIFLLSMVLISKITGERFLWRQISMIIFFIIIWGESLFNIFMQYRERLPKYAGHAIVILILGLSQFKPERFTKYPTRHYFVKISSVMPHNYHAWSEQLQENLDNRENRNYTSKHSSYHSRFRHLSPTDARAEFIKEFFDSRKVE
tara:strand:+ start:13334 stop:14944 length:1611 start_codon:yes stop_codon:yes gene_type:complete